jgi:hypothetical protein
MVTPKHNIIVKHPLTKNIKVAESESGIWGDNYKYPSSGYIHGESTLSVMERLLIAIQADGCVVNNCPSYDRLSDSIVIEMKFKKKRKIERIKELLINLSLNCNPRYRESDGHTVFKFSISKTLPLEWTKLIKNFGWVDLNSMSSTKAEQFIEELLFWDGSIGKYWYNTDKGAVDVVQSIATLAGISSVIGINRYAGESTIICDNTKPSISKTCYVVTFTYRDYKQYPHRKLVDYEDLVYCVTMPKGTVVTRRNGRVSIQGNCTHILGYKRLNDTLGYDSEEFMSEFLNYKEMKDKHEFMIDNVQLKTPTEIAKYLAKQVLLEGVQLFASFAMLLSYSKEGKLPGMVSVNQWSIADESLHTQGLSELFKIFLEENPKVVNNNFKSSIYLTAAEVVKLEDAFVDLCYASGKNTAVNKEELKAYIRYVTDYRMQQLGFKPQFGIKENPMPWMDLITSNTFANFFEATSVQYSKNSMTGDWVY